MNEIIIELYKCIGDEIESNKKYTILSDKMKYHEKNELANMVKSIADHKKTYIQELLKIIRECFKIEYTDNKELQELINNLNEVMIKSFI